MDTFNVGSIRVVRVEEWRGEFLSPADLFVGYDEEEFAKRVDSFPADVYNKELGQIYAFLQSWLLEVDGKKIIIDTGAGNDKVRPGIPLFGGLSTDFIRRLSEAGFPPEEIDLVICTHLHIDHVGWNTALQDDRWQPTFPNARYLFSEKDLEYWDPANRSRFPDKVGEAVNEGFFEDSVRPIVEAGRVDVVSGRHEVLPGLVLEPAPGHTPGHIVVRVESDGEHGMFVGDILHHPIQVYCPTWNSIFCEDGEQARATRKRVLSDAADTNALMFPAHFGGQHAVWITHADDGFEIALKQPA